MAVAEKVLFSLMLSAFQELVMCFMCCLFLVNHISLSLSLPLLVVVISLALENSSGFVAFHQKWKSRYVKVADRNYSEGEGHESKVFIICYKPKNIRPWWTHFLTLICNVSCSIAVSFFRHCGSVSETFCSINSVCNKEKHSYFISVTQAAQMTWSSRNWLRLDI